MNRRRCFASSTHVDRPKDGAWECHAVARAVTMGIALSWPFASLGQATVNRDYYSASGDLKARLEQAQHYHLQPAYDAMKRGAWEPARDNFEFILTGFPNAPQALNGISELCTLKWISPRCDAESWLEKAVAVNPSISTTWVIYGIHLQRKRLYREAAERFKRAIDLNPDDVNAHYNLGLMYFELKRYDEANEQAQLSYALGAQLPGLRDMLKRVRAWKPETARSSGSQVPSGIKSDPKDKN